MAEDAFVIRERDFRCGKSPVAIWTCNVRLLVPNRGKPSVYVRTMGYCLREEERDIVHAAVLAVEDDLFEELLRNVVRLVSDNCLKILAEINDVATVCDPAVLADTEFKRNVWDFQNMVTVAAPRHFNAAPPRVALPSRDLSTALEDDLRTTAWYVRNEVAFDEVSTRHTLEPVIVNPSSLVRAVQLVAAYNGVPKAARTLREAKGQLNVLLGDTRELMLAIGNTFATNLRRYATADPLLRATIAGWREPAQRRLNFVAVL